MAVKNEELQEVIAEHRERVNPSSAPERTRNVETEDTHRPEGNGWSQLRKIFGAREVPETQEKTPDLSRSVTETPTVETPKTSEPEEKAASVPVTPPKAQEEMVTVSKADLDRMVQSRSDVQIAEKNRETRDTARATRLKELRDIREENPHAYALGMAELDEEDAQTETDEQAAQGTGALIKHVANQFDQNVVLPIVEMLPDKDREELLNQPFGTGMPARTEFVKSAVERLIRGAYAVGGDEREKKLRASPEFQKLVRADLRDATEEAELVNAPAVQQPAGMNDRIRALWQSRSAGL